MIIFDKHFNQLLVEFTVDKKKNPKLFCFQGFSVITFSVLFSNNQAEKVNYVIEAL